MDFPVEATVHLSAFRNETQVREILRSHGFELTDLSRDQVRVRGSFLELGAAKASLEMLLNSQTKKDTAPSSSSPVPKVSSGAISKYYTTRSDTNRSQSKSWNKHAPSPPTFSSSLMTGSTSNHPTSPKRSTFSPTPDRRSSPRAREEFVFVDADVFHYAERLRRKDMDSILDCHNVMRRAVHRVRDSYIITLQGRSVGKSVGKLQSLLDDLNKSLRTQEVPLKDMNPEGRALFQRIQKSNNICGSVLVRPEEGKLHLIGPSGESYELKQRLLGRPVDRSGRTGRTLDRNARGRSSSLPPITRKSTERDGGATGHFPSKYQELKQEVAEPKQEATATAAAPLSGPIWRRSHSESRNRNPAGRTPGKVQDTQTKDPHPKSPIKSRAQLLLLKKTDDMKQMFKKMRK